MKPGQIQEYFFTIRNETSEAHPAAIEFTEISYSQAELADHLQISIASPESGQEYLSPTLLRTIISNRYHQLERIAPNQSHDYRLAVTLLSDTPNSLELGELQFSLRTGLQEKIYQTQSAPASPFPSSTPTSSPLPIHPPSPQNILQPTSPSAIQAVLGTTSSSTAQTPPPHALPTQTFQHTILLPTLITFSFLLLFLLALLLARKNRRPS